MMTDTTLTLNIDAIWRSTERVVYSPLNDGLHSVSWSYIHQTKSTVPSTYDSTLPVNVRKKITQDFMEFFFHTIRILIFDKFVSKGATDSNS